MIWQFTVQDALFLLSIIIFGLIGYRRGWQREIVSLLFIIVGLAFLNLNGGTYLSKLLYQFLEGKPISDTNLLHSHHNVWLFVTIGSLVVIIALGYIIGSRSPKAKDGQARTLGLIPGLITGAVIGAELTYFLLPNSGKSVITTGTIQMNLNFLGNLTVLLIFVIAVVVVVIGLMATRPKKSGGGGGGEKK
jgi:uncharacterized membrane protein required for colicin V production